MATDAMAHTTTGPAIAAVVDVLATATAVPADTLAGREMVGMQTMTDLGKKEIVALVGDAERMTWAAGRGITTTPATTIPVSEDTSQCLMHGLLGGFPHHSTFVASLTLSGKIATMPASHLHSQDLVDHIRLSEHRFKSVTV